jgi:DNA gyrase/topoisomerase IV subunit B
MATIEHQVGQSSVRLAIGIKQQPAERGDSERGQVPDVIGFVNGLPCHEGTHANWAFLQLAHKIRIGDKTVHPATLRARRQVFFVIDLSIPNPDFSSQTKESLKTPSQKWPCLVGGWDWPDAVDKLIKRSKLVESLQRVAQAEAASEQLSQLQSKIDEQTGRGARRRVNVEGLADAAQAGTGNRECALWITEGKSAMTHLMGGMSQAQRSVFGMMAIRGKILNALKHSDVKTMANTEIMGIIAAMGLSIKARDDVSKLRYPGGIVWATDQDGDGRHIAALGTVTLCTLFPVLRAIPGFFKFLNTPLLRCKGLGRDKSELEFDSSQAFIDWKRRYEAAEGCAVEDRFAIKYYKGLATLESADVRRVFQQLAARLVTLVLDAETHAIMLKYFDKDQEDARKDALCELANRLNRGETAPII